MHVTVNLPDEIYRLVERLAQLTGRDLPTMLGDTLAVSYLLLSSTKTSERPLSEATNTEVMALADATMDPTQDERLSVLLDRQQADELRAEERVELMTLMQMVQEGTLAKARALHEAVRRGLREPLSP